MTAPASPLDRARHVIGEARANGRRAIDEVAAKHVLESFGLAVPKGLRLAGGSVNGDDLAALRFPVAVKLISDDVRHKSDAGYVALNLEDPEAVCAAIRRMHASAAEARHAVDGFLVEEMAPAGTEVVIGGFRDPTFGPVIMFGLGGIHVEVLGDVSFRVCPIDRADAAEMIEDLRSGAILDGVRGGGPADREALIGLLLAIGGRDGLMCQLGNEIAELDINPVIINARGAVAVDALMLLTETATAAERRVEPAPAPARPDFDVLFTPRTVAIAGASSTSTAYGNRFLRTLRANGFRGEIYPIHPTAATIEGLPAYPALSATPLPVDYAFVAVNAGQVVPLIETAGGNVRFAQVMSSGFADVPGGLALERRLVETAHGHGVRIIGPNCIGLHSPRGGLSLIDDPGPARAGVAFISQSGGLSLDVLRYGKTRGIPFSAVVSLGNSADIGPADMLAYFLEDPDTTVIGLYLEQVSDGRQLFEILHAARARKPIVILKGGRTRAGQRAAASHTGALASDQRIWDAMLRQTGSITVSDLDGLLTVFAGLHNHDPAATAPVQRAVLFGNGGGTSVVATDLFAAHGIEVGPLAEPLTAELDALEVPHGASVANPIDVPANLLLRDDGKTAGRIITSILAHAAKDGGDGAVVFHLNLSVMGNYDDDALIERMVAAVAEAAAGRRIGVFHLVLRSDRAERTEALKRRLTACVEGTGITVLDEISESARVLKAIRDLAIHRGRRAS